jgi:hypothetical protein
MSPTMAVSIHEGENTDARARVRAVDHTFEPPRNVAPQRLEPPAAAPRMTFKLAQHSYTFTQVAVTA